MSLFGALQTGVAGLDAQSAALSVTSSNIANVNTVGYKDSEAQFETLLAGYGDITDASVMESTSQNVSQQGTPTATSVSTNMAISGNGFFVVSNTNPGAANTTGAGSATGTSASSLYYTRTGDFTPDADGNLENSSGYYLMGWPLTSTGSLPTNTTDLVPVNVSALSGKSEPTTTMTLQANLQASTTATSSYAAGDMAKGTVTPDFQKTIDIYDSQGGEEPLDVSYVKTGADQWNYEVTYQGDSSNLTGTTNSLLASGTMTFNSDGTLKGVASNDGSSTVSGGSISLNIPWSTGSGLASQPLTINMGTLNSSSGVTQYDSASTLVSSNVDGALFGSLTGVSIGTNGIVTANFSNGLSENIYQVPLATFADPDGLTAISGNSYQASTSSGTANINQANTGGAGTVNSDSVEASTVDLATEFTNLITSQRAYQASAQIISTASSMLQDLFQQVQ
jgi:flagellar hook protein FlgE